MPCYDGRENQPRIIYESGIDPQTLEIAKRRLADAEAKANNLSKEKDLLTAMICALINELERRNIAPQVIAEASRNGLINIMAFYKGHRGDDVARLALELHKYSKDEQAILKSLLVSGYSVSINSEE